jgi:putative tryptophan/tyrosine transport system substrate-binding protein
MRRREFVALALVGSGATAWPLITRAQQGPKLPTIGFLGSSTPSAMTAWIDAFVQRLHELSWIEGRTVAIEYRWAEGRDERYAQIADEFVRLKVNVIVTYGTPPTKAAKQATTAIPIVFAAAADPVGNTLVSSLARPGGNVTGLSLQQSDIVGKKLELLREVVSGLRRLAVMGNVGNPAVVLEIGEVKTAADRLGIDIVSLAIRRAEDISPALMRSKGARRRCTPDLAAMYRLPALYGELTFAHDGGLIAYGIDRTDPFKRAASYVNRILNGEKSSDLPVQQPTKFEFVINLKTAKALGLDLPLTLQMTADEVIQ